MPVQPPRREMCRPHPTPKIKQATETEIQAEEKQKKQRANPEHRAGWKLQKSPRQRERKERISKKIEKGSKTRGKKKEN